MMARMMAAGQKNLKEFPGGLLVPTGIAAGRLSSSRSVRRSGIGVCVTVRAVPGGRSGFRSRVHLPRPVTLMQGIGRGFFDSLCKARGPA